MTDKSQREVLPAPDRRYQGLITHDAKDPASGFDPIREVRPPSDAPNILVVLLDDVGFGASSAFGGPCSTPVAERLARDGLKYNRFHTTALCSPTRAALLTGRNHHTVGMGGITEIATGAPGYTSVIPNTCAPLAEVLKLNGYSTGQFGKCHEVPVWETSPMGPFRQWPTGQGFEHFYGFIGGETNQWAPAVYQDTVPIEPENVEDPDYHFGEDMTDHTIGWIRQQKALMPDKPFFAYYAPGGTHAPHHVPRAWSDKYRGRFDDGWDVLRDRTFTRQQDLGVVPQDAQLTSRPDEIPAWDDMPDELKPVLARQMEVYAGFLDHTDHQVGRVVDALEDLEILDDTLIFYIIGDNGASAEGTINGTFNELFGMNGAAAMETPEFMAARIDDFGGPDAYNHFAVGWAHAMDTPYQWTKQVASHWGGTRNGTVVHWPNGFSSRGEVRTQFHHVIDVAATVMEAAGLAHPTFVNGVQQEPLHGTSMVETFDDADAPDAHTTQYFEMFVNRGIYHEGWTAVTRHSIPWGRGKPLPAIDDDVWELYGPDDWTQANDLAHDMPEKLASLQRLFLIEAARYNVLPLDDRTVERFDAAVAGRPTLIKGRSQLLFGGMGRLPENSVLNLKNKSHAVTAQITIGNEEANGVIIAQGGAFGGWVLYMLSGKPVYCYNLFGVQRFKIHGQKTVGEGEHQIRAEFDYDGGGLAKGGTLTLYVDGEPVGEGRIDATQPLVFSADETTDIGSDTATSVTDDFTSSGTKFTGRVEWVQLDTGDDAEDADHYITPEERMRVAMAIQ